MTASVQLKKEIAGHESQDELTGGKVTLALA
jgi:hypothetical protein